MAGEMDKVKGKIKDAIGGMTDDHDLQGEGKVDQAVGTVEDKADKATDWVKDKVNHATK